MTVEEKNALIKSLAYSINNYFDSDKMEVFESEKYPCAFAILRNKNMANKFSKGNITFSAQDNGAIFAYDNENNIRLYVNKVINKLIANGSKPIKQIVSESCSPIYDNGDKKAFMKKIKILFAEETEVSKKLEKLECIKSYIDNCTSEYRQKEFYDLYEPLKEARDIELNKNKWKKYTNGNKTIKAPTCPEGYWHVSESPPGSVIHVDFTEESNKINIMGLFDD